MDNYTRAVPGSDLSGDPGHGGVQPMKTLKGGCSTNPGFTQPAGAESPGTAIPGGVSGTVEGQESIRPTGLIN